MRPKTLLLVAAIQLVICCASEADQAIATPGSHGGKVQRQGGFQCEVVCHDRAVAVYVFDENGNPIPTARVRGQVAVRFEGQPRRYRYDLYPRLTTRLANCLSAPADLARHEAASLTVSVYGLSTSNARPLSLAATYRRKPAATKSLPQATDPIAARATAADGLAVTQQRLCPVIDKPLDSMGGPWKVTVKGKPVFVCCKGCIGRVRKHPDRYLKKAAQFVAATPRDTIR